MSIFNSVIFVLINFNSSNIVTNWEFSLNCAKKLDENDELRLFRDYFHIPIFLGKNQFILLEILLDYSQRPFYHTFKKN